MFRGSGFGCDISRLRGNGGPYLSLFKPTVNTLIVKIQTLGQAFSKISTFPFESPIFRIICHTSLASWKVLEGGCLVPNVPSHGSRREHLTTLHVRACREGCNPPPIHSHLPSRAWLGTSLVLRASASP